MSFYTSYSVNSNVLECLREGAHPRISGLFFNTVVHAVLLLGSEMWVLNNRMDWALGSFQHRVAQRITRRRPRWQRGGRWEYPLLAAAMEEASFEEIGVYITRRQNTFAQYIATRPIIDLYERSFWRPGASVS